jgi:hypothetical protein
MSCEGNRRHYFEMVAPQAGVSAADLEALFWRSRRAPDLGELAMLTGKTELLFRALEAVGLKRPSHAADGLPKLVARPGYAAVYDLLAQRGVLGGQVALQRTAVASASLPGTIFWADPDTQAAYDNLGRDGKGYDRWGYDRIGFDCNCVDREGYNHSGFDESGFNRRGFNVHGFDRQGFNALGYNRHGFDRQGCDLRGYNKSGRDADGYDLWGYDAEGYDRAGYDKTGRDRQGSLAPFFTQVDAEGFFADGYNAQGYDRDGYNVEGYDAWGFGKDGYNWQGYSRLGFDRWGYDVQGHDAQGYNRQGLRKDPATRLSLNRQGYTNDGYDVSGYSFTGFNKDGLDRNGLPRMTVDKRGNTIPVKFNKSGYDADGYDRWGYHHKTGLTAPDAQDRRYNLYGWLYDPATGYCANPNDPNERVQHDGNCAVGRMDKWSRARQTRYFGIYIRQQVTQAPTATVPVTPRASMTEAEYNRCWRYADDSVRPPYAARVNPPNSDLAERWQRVGRALSDPLAVNDGVRLRCPKCGRFSGGATTHVCPALVGTYGGAVTVWRSGVVTIGGVTTKVTDLRPLEAPDEFSEGGYNAAGYDVDGYDRLGRNAKGFTRQGYTADGFDMFGYDRDGYDRRGYNNAGRNRRGETRPRTLGEIAPDLDQDALNNDDLAQLYSRLATGLVGQPRRVHLVEGGGFATDMKGMIRADPYPLGREADPCHNLVVTRAGIYHELGHEKFTDLSVWARVLEIANSTEPVAGLDNGRKLLAQVFNIVEDGRMERQVSAHYAGVAEILAASCRLEPRWDEHVGGDLRHELVGSLLYTSLPYYRVRDEVRAAMSPQGRALFEELEPLVQGAVRGSAADALEASIAITRRLEAAGLIEPEPDVQTSQPPPVPAGTQPFQGGQAQPGQGQGRPAGQSQEQPQGQGRQPGQGQDQPGRQPGQGQEQPEPGPGQEPGQVPGQGEGLGSGGGKGDYTPPASPQPSELADPTADFDEAQLDAVLDVVERDAVGAVESGLRRRARADVIGKPLHKPLGDATYAEQRYRGLDGMPRTARINMPRYDDETDLLAGLAARRPEHRRVSQAMARQLAAIREQAEQRLRGQSEGNLDTTRLVEAVTGEEDVYTEDRQMPRTSFAASVAVDMSGSMSSLVRGGQLYDATLTLGDTFAALEMPYEVRGFGSCSVQFKSLGDARFDPGRAAGLAAENLGGTQLGETAGLATSSLMACPEQNRLFISLTDGELGDQAESAAVLAEARRQKMVTFGIFLGGHPPTEAMDQLYGRGNWTTIQSLADMPKAVGQRLASIFKRMGT